MARFSMVFGAGLIAFLAQGQVAAQTMYKCVGPDGSQIFSHQPCPADAEQVGASGSRGSQAARRTEQLAAISQRKSECIRHANALAYNQADLRIRQHNDRITYIEGRMANGNVAETGRMVEMREEIADLRQSVSNEREKADADFAIERTRCEEAERRASAALSNVG